MIQLKESQIEAELLVCPYCMSEVSHNATGCCGESSAHFETGYATEDEIYLKSQIEIVKD
jgi:hypothetical protein